MKTIRVIYKKVPDNVMPDKDIARWILIDVDTYEIVNAFYSELAVKNFIQKHLHKEEGLEGR